MLFCNIILKHMLIRRSIILILMFLFYTGYSQISLNRDTSLNIYENGNRFKSALSGGINSGQFSEIDLDLDGIRDLIIFDKAGNRINPFLNINGTYIYAPEYRINFPITHDWMLLADYNCDGKNDIYTYSTGGITIYKNTSNTSLNFTLVDSLVLTDLGSHNQNIVVFGSDIPAISDIDYDGDLDILTFGITGGFIEYHKNMAIEMTGNCDTIAFKKTDECWGLFYEGLNSYVLNCPNCQCPSIMQTSTIKQKHGASTLLAIDIDNDNDKDLVLGDDTYKNLNLLINGGDNQNAIIVSVDSVFPKNFNNTLEVNIDVFPSSYYIDVTNDGIKDLIVSTNSDFAENFESCWIYENLGQNNSPDFHFVEKNFLQGKMVDLGKSAFPTFYDYNNDGLLDLVIGNYGYHDINNPDPLSSLALFKNIGTNNIPEFDLIDRNWQNIASINLNISQNIPAYSLSPTFGDLDGDGDHDMILGDESGLLHYFTNQNGNFTISTPNYQNIDIGNIAQPQLVDVNRDGLLDLIIGEQDGTINYCPNSGSISNASFDTIIQNWGGIDVDSSFISSGFSSPKLIDINGTYQLFVGSYTGKIYHFTNIDGNINGLFTELNQTDNIWDGGKSAIAISDINNDMKIDMIIGNVAGGISYFSSDTMLINLNQENIIKNNKLILYPNPSDGSFSVESEQNGLVMIYNLLGQKIYVKEKDTKRININNLRKGIYQIKLNTLTQTIIIK